MYNGRKQLLLDATGGGLDIIQKHLPDAAESVNRRQRKFKLRESEKTASCSLYEQGGVYYVTDFGGDQRRMDGIALVAYLQSIEYGEALTLLCGEFGISDKGPGAEKIKPKETWEDIHAGDVKGHCEVINRQDWPEFWQQVMGPYTNPERCAEYSLYAVAKITRVVQLRKGSLKRLIIEPSEYYPIFHLQGIGWGKLYEPCNPDKGRRFISYGKKPARHLWGLNVVEKKHMELREQMPAEQEEGEKKQEGKHQDKLLRVMIASGERDATQLMGRLGENEAVVWKNSESEPLEWKQWESLRYAAKMVVNVPDIDITGKRKGRDLALQYLDMRTAWLPDKLLSKKDSRGNPCNDFRDACEHLSRHELDSVLDSAMPAKWWFQKKGEKGGYDVQDKYLLYWLMLNGYYVWPTNSSESDPDNQLVQIHNNRIDFVQTPEIKRGCLNFVEQIEPKNHTLHWFMLRSSRFTKANLLMLRELQYERNFTGKDFQYLFFKNETWKVTADEIQAYRPYEIDVLTWKRNVKPWKVKKIDSPAFTIKTDDATGLFDITIPPNPSVFLRFLECTSRVYWADDNRDNLSHAMKMEESHHLVNKIYVIGYLLHRYKTSGRPWAAIGVDGRMTDGKSSQGGSGKSLLMVAVGKMINQNYYNAERCDFGQFWNDDVYSDTDMLLFDDANRSFAWRELYAPITGALKIERKNQKGKETIPFSESPKVGVTSNFVPEDDGSTMRRLLFYICYDFFHDNKNGEYKRKWDPKDEFGHTLFEDWNEQEWNRFANLMAQCLQFYLSQPDMVAPPMNEVRQRQYRMVVGEQMLDYFEAYLTGDKLNKIVIRAELYEDYKTYAKDEKHKFLLTSTTWAKKFKAYCNYKGYKLNPPERCDLDEKGRILQRVDAKTQECFFIEGKLPGYEAGQGEIYSDDEHPF